MPSVPGGGLGFDYDYVVIGSGFGGAVSALRLGEKGWRVAVLETGKRWRPEDFAVRNRNLRRPAPLPGRLVPIPEDTP